MANAPPAPARTTVSGSALVLRPALMELLERGAGGSVTVVAAAAGSGKTVLVRTWLERRGGAARSAAWVGVERGERDPQRFWSAVIGELRAAAPAGMRIEGLTPTPEFDGAAAVRRLLANLASATGLVVLVIDDVHEIAAPEILEQLTYLLSRLPSTVHVVLITRRDPQLGLHRRRLDGGLTEIRSADLQFTLEESQRMLSGFGITLSEPALRLLHERTEGWVAGLRLAAVALAGHSDPERFVKEFSGSERTVAEYLVAEVLNSQPPHVRRLLVRTSLLDRINGRLADLLTGLSGTEHHFQTLADTGGFVIPVDANRTWFRFHHLFADLLAAELRHTEPDEIPRLHHAAARWYADNGHVIEAISHAQAAGEHDLAAGLLIEHYFSLMLDGRQATASSLLQSSPLDGSPGPEIATVVANEQLAAGSLDQARAYLALAERHAAEVPENRRHRFEMALLVTRLSLFRRLGDFQSVTDVVQRAGTMVEPESGYDISMHNDVRALMLMNLGIVEVWSGRDADGVRHLEEARALAERIGRPYLQVSAQAHWADAITWDSFTRAGAACEDVVALAERHGWGEDPVISPALVAWAVSLMQTGRLTEAEQMLARADQTVRAELEPAQGFLLNLVHGGVHLALGRSGDAIASFRAAERLELLLVTGSRLGVQLRCSMLHAMLDLGETDAVRDALAELSEPERDLGAFREIRARLALAMDDPASAVEVLAPTLKGRAQTRRVVILVRSLILEALARDALGETDASEDALERALDLAETDALILPFLHIPSRELLERQPRHRTAHGAFLTEILDVISGRAPAPANARASALSDELSDAELRVLRFMPTNLTAAGIASEIYVSINTVKTHMRHIYAKLDVHTRVEAVDRARELGILGSSVRHR